MASDKGRPDDTIARKPDPALSAGDSAIVSMSPEVMREFIDIAVAAIRADQNRTWLQPRQALLRLGAEWFGRPVFDGLIRGGPRQALRLSPEKEAAEFERIVDLMIARAVKAGGVPRTLYDRMVKLAFAPGVETERPPLPADPDFKQLLDWARSEPVPAKRSDDASVVSDSIQDVGDGENTKDNTVIDWAGRGSGMTAFEYFEAKFGSIPFERRPSADQIRQASLTFYRSLSKHQSRQGQSIGDLFPIDPQARGGAKVKGGGDLSHEALLARLERQRENRRRSMAKWRAKKAQP